MKRDGFLYIKNVFSSGNDEVVERASVSFWLPVVVKLESATNLHFQVAWYIELPSCFQLFVHCRSFLAIVWASSVQTFRRYWPFLDFTRMTTGNRYTGGCTSRLWNINSGNSGLKTGRGHISQCCLLPWSDFLHFWESMLGTLKLSLLPCTLQASMCMITWSSGRPCHRRFTASNW